MFYIKCSWERASSLGLLAPPKWLWTPPHNNYGIFLGGTGRQCHLIPWCLKIAWSVLKCPGANTEAQKTNNSANFLIRLRCIVTSSNHKTCKESDIWQNRCVQKRTLFPQKMQNAFPLMISTVRVFLTSPTKLRETDASIRKVRQNKSPREFSAKTQKSNQINLFPIHRSNPNNCAPDTLVIDKSTFTRVGDAKPKVVGNHWRSHNMRYQLQFRFLVSELDYISSINTHAILTKCFCLLEDIKLKSSYVM